MRWDTLLHWMTHVGEGSWVKFKNSVSQLADEGVDVVQAARTVRLAMSDLAQVDFFVEGSQRWKVLPPLLGGLAMDESVVVVAGGRTPTIEAELVDAVRARGCRFVDGLASEPNQPTSFHIAGPPADLAVVAQDVGVFHVRNLAAGLCGQVIPIPQRVSCARTENPMGGWSVQSFDLQSLKWIDGLHPRCACEFRSRYGERRFYLHTHHGKLLRLPKREAVYAAAMINRVTLTEYDTTSATLRTMAAAPLPEAFSRAASMCAGAVARYDRGCLVYRGVPLDIAAFLLVAAGQPYPRAPWRDTPLAGNH